MEIVLTAEKQTKTAPPPCQRKVFSLASVLQMVRKKQEHEKKSLSIGCDLMFHI